MMFIEIFFAGALVIGLFITSEDDTKYIFAGLLIMYIASVTDVTAILSYRREQRRRKSLG